MLEKPATPRIDRIVLINNLDGKIYARCYSGSNFTDAVMPYGCLANLVADGAKILAGLYQVAAVEEQAKAS